ncbi:MAG: hypothetical protein A2033_17430 [Bacteroidetes bacterium GWA2_31_9]|nr:MAG: hypothetical protein A2033_17430 [Bacteroidetes bacterium GWA2_31_9]
MKIFVAILFLLFVSKFTFSQQIQQYNLIFLDPSLVSPSLNQESKNSSLKIHDRIQWRGFDDAPVTNSLSYVMKLNKKMGAGLYYLQDKYGIFKKNEISLSYSYSIKFLEADFIFGLSAKLLTNNINYYQKTRHEQIDPLIFNGNNYLYNKPESDFGITIIKNNLQASVAFQNIISSKNGISSNKIYNQRVYNCLIKYDYIITNQLAFYPNIYLSSNFYNPYLLMVAGIFNISNNLNLGLIYNHRNSVDFLIGYSGKYFSIFYTYDFIYNSIRKTNNGSHEILLNFKLSNLSKVKALYDLKGEKRGQIKNRLE